MVKRRIIDMFAFFDYSKAAEALNVHTHAACTCNGRSRVGWDIARPMIWQLWVGYERKEKLDG